MGIRGTNALLRPSYTPLEAALYNRWRMLKYSDIIDRSTCLNLPPQSLQSGLVPLPLLGDRGLRERPRGRRREGAVVGTVLAARQDVLRGVPAAPAAHLPRDVAVRSPDRTVFLLVGDS